MEYVPESIRYLLASVPYRKKLNFTFEGLPAAQKSIERIRDFELRISSANLPPGRDETIAARSAEAIHHLEGVWMTISIRQKPRPRSSSICVP
jgi:cysteinyl-tRNA synthetase